MWENSFGDIVLGLSINNYQIGLKTSDLLESVIISKMSNSSL